MVKSLNSLQLYIVQVTIGLFAYAAFFRTWWISSHTCLWTMMFLLVIQMGSYLACSLIWYNWKVLRKRMVSFFFFSFWQKMNMQRSSVWPTPSLYLHEMDQSCPQIQHEHSLLAVNLLYTQSCWSIMSQLLCVKSGFPERKERQDGEKEGRPSCHPVFHKERWV